MLQSPTSCDSQVLPPRDAATPLHIGTVYVAYTSPRPTEAAMRAAWRFARSLDVPVTLVHFRVTPYPLGLEDLPGISPIETEAFRTALTRDGITVRGCVYACRQIDAAIHSALPSSSLVFVGGANGWFSPSRRLRRRLEAAGHLVISVDPASVEENVHA